MISLMCSVAAVSSLYALGCVLYITYSAAIVRSAQLENELSRSQESKVSTKKIANFQIEKMKIFWKWPKFLVEDYKKIKDWK